MPPTLILIRHAQAQHNVAEDYTIPDPPLTELGLAQCKKLREKLKATLPGRLDPELIVVSPMTRTLQTAMTSLDWLMAAGVPIKAHAGWQETTDHVCDIGSPLPGVVAQFPQIDFTDTDPIFPDKLSPAAAFYAYDRHSLVVRAQTVLAELYARPEKVIVVVSHSSFLSKAVCGAMYGNADYRIFSFLPPVAETAPEARPAFDDLPPLVYRLHEWDETRQGHGGMGWSYDTFRQIGELLPEED